MQDIQLILGKPISRVEAGKSAEIIVELILENGENTGPIGFRIERGNISSAQVEFMKAVGDGW
jgi:hypothetical protein